MLVDEDAYLAEMEQYRDLNIEKPVTHKIPFVNIQKLPFDKKVVPIVVSIGKQK